MNRSLAAALAGAALFSGAGSVAMATEFPWGPGGGKHDKCDDRGHTWTCVPPPQSGPQSPPQSGPQSPPQSGPQSPPQSGPQPPPVNDPQPPPQGPLDPAHRL